jgi:adenine/guanine phosphoribosyltransferase-like PRPP-binding protein
MINSTKTKISFPQIRQALENAELPHCKLVVGIADSGLIPAILVACKIGCDIRIIKFNYRNENNVVQHPEPLLLNSISLPANVNNILIVDDVTVSGKTLNAAKKLFRDKKIMTMVFVGQADYVLFPQIATCVDWPWNLR